LALQAATGSMTFISGDSFVCVVKAVPVISGKDRSDKEAMQIIINNDLPVNYFYSPPTRFRENDSRILVILYISCGNVFYLRIEESQLIVMG